MKEMDVNNALAFIEEIVFERAQKQLTDLERAVFRGAWQGKSFQEIHKIECAHVGLEYLMKHVGPKLWQLLSKVIEEKVSKSKLQGPVERALHRYNQQEVVNSSFFIGYHDQNSNANFEHQLCSSCRTTRQEVFIGGEDRANKLQCLSKQNTFAQLELEDRQVTPMTLKLPRGQVCLTSNFYVERPPIESSCYQEIVQPGALIQIKGFRQMGKTSLMAKILNRAREKNYRTVTLSLQLADAKVFTNLDKFLKWFCACVAQSLLLPNNLADYWNNNFGSNYNSTTYFEEYLLAEIASPLVVALDEVDRVFSYPEIANDFFSLLRAWYEKAKYGDTNSNIWEKLRLVIVHSTEVYISTDNNQFPFNVGLLIDLPEFKVEQVKDLTHRYQLNWSDVQLEQLWTMMGGHPYLVHLAMYHIAHKHITLKQLLQTATTEAGLYSDYLRRHLWNLEQHPELAVALCEVVNTNSSVKLQLALAFKLYSMGLVEMEGNNVKPRCNLYRQYFRDRLRGGR